MTESILHVLPSRGDWRLSFQNYPIPSVLIAEAVEALSHLIARYRREGERTGILLGNSPLFVSSLLSIMSLDTSAVLLNPALRPYELDAAIRDARIGLLLSSADLSDEVLKLAFEPERVGGAAMFPWGEVHVWVLRLPEPSVDITLPQQGEFTSQFTSGVSGEPRIASRTYSNIIDEIENYVSTVSLSPDDIVLCPAPLFHAYGLFNGLIPSLHIGATCILVPRFVPADIIALTQRYRPTVLLGVPFMYELLSRTFVAESADFSCYRLLFSAGAKLSRKVADEFHARFGADINQLYGSTETGIISVNLPCEGPFDVDSVGRPVSGRLIHILSEDGVYLPPGNEGEIAVLSAGTTSGYLNREDLSRTKFRDGWYLTGDIGYTNDRGFLYVTGRKSSFINVAGLKVDPVVIEQVLVASGLVAECAVLGIPRLDSGEIIRAYVVLREGGTVSGLRAFCRSHLASFKIPREFVVIDTLPRSPAGKVLRKYLLDYRS